MSTQKCSKCHKSLPLSDFTKTKKQCKQCRSEIALSWYREKSKCPDFRKQKAKEKMDKYWANRDSINDRRYKKRLERDYGITYEDFQRMFELQPGCCRICGIEITWRGGKKSAHVDHCHKTGAARGLLCFNCNSGLGQFKDSPELLAKAVEYLTGLS